MSLLLFLVSAAFLYCLFLDVRLRLVRCLPITLYILDWKGNSMCNVSLNQLVERTVQYSTVQDVLCTLSLSYVLLDYATAEVIII